MYTVIIQSRTAKESYDEFYPLLANTVYEKSDVKVCEWIETATTLGTAVPELMHAIERKKQWRAIVVQLDLEAERKKEQTVDGNPYDFVHYHYQQTGTSQEELEQNDAELNKSDPKDKKEKPQQLHFQRRILQGDVTWSEIPLVRITQMLKGIPEPVPVFEDEEENEDGKQLKRGNKEAEKTEAPTVNDGHPAVADPKEAEKAGDEDFTGKEPLKFVFNEPELIEEKKKEVQKWNKEHLCQFSPPAEIVLIRVRRRIFGVHSYEMENRWGAYWDTRDSSRFRWENGYADGCRFLVFDVDTHGELRHRSDMFRLWLCVQLLSENRINSNTLQADRLYRMDVELEEKKLSENLQKTANQLNYAQYESTKYLKEMQKAAESDEEDDDPDDEFTVDKKIKVDLDDVNQTGFLIDEDDYTLTVEDGLQDKSIWKSYTERTRLQWIKLLRSVQRKLASAARTLRAESQPSPQEVVPLDEYREEDLHDRLDEYYAMILEEQERLPASEFDLKEDLEKRDKEVHKAILGRIRTRSAICVWLLPSLLIAASMCYGFFSGGSPAWLGIAVGVTILLIILVVWVVLRIRFGDFIRTLKNYEAVYLRALLVLANGSAIYSSFFSKIASRIYGENYLTILALQCAKEAEKNAILDRKIRKVEWFQETLERWCEALQFDVDMDNQEAVRTMAENKYRLHEENLYQLATGIPRSVEIGHTGTYVQTTYDFIKGMTIEREEVFDRE